MAWFGLFCLLYRPLYHRTQTAPRTPRGDGRFCLEPSWAEARANSSWWIAVSSAACSGGLLACSGCVPRCVQPHRRGGVSAHRSWRPREAVSRRSPPGGAQSSASEARANTRAPPGRSPILPDSPVTARRGLLWTACFPVYLLLLQMFADQWHGPGGEGENVSTLTPGRDGTFLLLGTGWFPHRADPGEVPIIQARAVFPAACRVRSPPGHPG